MSKPFVYVAGPFTYPEPIANTRTAIMAGNDLMKNGFIPFVPHLSLLWQFLTPLDYRTWLEYDFEIVRRSDAVYRLPGQSPGADEEEQIAKAAKIPIFYELAELIAWRDEKKVA